MSILDGRALEGLMGVPLTDAELDRIALLRNPQVGRGSFWRASGVGVGVGSIQNAQYRARAQNARAAGLLPGVAPIPCQDAWFS
jgi:hypothetical protein